MKKSLFSLSLIAGIALSSLAYAADYSIDTSHSEVLFKIKHLGISTVTGRFETFDGGFSFDAAKPESSKTSVTIQADSIKTGSDKRDEHLKGEDFFEVAKYPTLSYVSKSVKALGDDKYEIIGDLTMHGVTNRVVLTAELTGAAKDPWGNERVAFNAEGKLNRKDFGITYNKVLDSGSLMLDETVKIVISLEGIKKVVVAAPAASTKK